jgi:iron complex outermembrane receptor protein
VTFPVVAIRSGGSIHNRSGALFGQASYDLTSRLSLTGGLRYTRETKTFLPDQIVLADPTGAFPPGSAPGFRLVPFVRSRQSIDEVTPSASLAFRWSEQVLTYASYSEGFKSGGFTQRIFPPLPAPPAFRPEFARAYEVGFKAETPGRRLRLNGAAYLTHYDDLQVQVLVGVQPLTANAAAARVSGFELELEAAPAPPLRITAGLGLTDAEYTKLDPNVVRTGVSLDSRFAQVPRWTANLGAAYTLNALSGDLTPRIDVSYRSAAYMTAANTPSLRQGAYALVNAAVMYAPHDRPWRVTLFAQNLTDRAYFAGGFADLVDQGYAEAAIGRPREWGLTLDLRY